MTEIVAFFEIFILLTCSVYSAFRVARAIAQKRQQEPEKEALCDTCEHLILKGGDIEPRKYKCAFLNGSFNESPEYCRNYERREEKNKSPKEEP